MPLYTCEYCNISTNIVTHYKRHLNTMKHQRNTKGLSSEYTKNIQKEPKRANREPKKSQKEPKRAGKEPGKIQQYICDFCNEEFKTYANKRRHELHRCKENSNNLLKLIDNKDKELLKMEKDKEDLKKHIELLITKVGNTTTNITNTQNIQLNSYGNEDMSHISDSLMRGLLKLPYGMIPKMIEAVHFSDNKPENKNISFPNKKDNKIKIYRGNKWIYKDKDSIINDLIDGKYFIMDSYYEEVCNKMSDGNRVSYEEFRKVFDREDKELHEDIKKDCELVLLNNR